MGALAGQHAVVTGASRGIGLAIASALAAGGARVTLVGRNPDTLAAAAENVGHGARARAADVTDEAAITGALEQAAREAGPVTILVNNAGGVDSKPFKRLTADDLRASLDLNLMSVFHASRAVLPGMLERGTGRIVNIASTAGQKGYAYVSHYCAAKHAVIGLTRALAVEVAKSGVTVNAVCPGYTDTDLLRGSVDTIQAKTGLSREQALAQMLAGNPQGRPVLPEEVAAAVLWLCGPGAASVTGQSIGVSGGEVT